MRRIARRSLAAHRLTRLACLIAGLATLPALAPAFAQQEPQRGGTLRIAQGSLRTADPHRHTGDSPVQQVYAEALTSISHDGSVKPMLAERVEVSPDGLAYTFHLRRGVRFHNGREMTSADVVANVERVRDRVQGGWLTTAMRGLRAVEAPDPHTVRFVLAEPFAPFTNLLSELWILAPETEGWATTINRPIGTGPFRFAEYRPNIRFVGEANRDYWQAGLPRLDAVEFDIRQVADRSLALRAGDIHVARIPDDAVETVRRDPNLRVTFYGDTEWCAVSFNNRSPRGPFADLRVRRAIAHAFDKEAFMQTVGNYVVGNQMAAPGSYHWDEAMERADPYRQPDLARTRALLAEAGVVPARTPLRIVSWQNDYSLFTAQTMRGLGFNVEHIALDDIGMQTRLTRYDWDLTPVCSGPRADIYLRFVRLMSEGPRPQMWGGIQDARLDQLISQAVTTVDDAARRRRYLEAWQHVMDSHQVLVLGHRRSPIGVRAEVRDFQPGFTVSPHRVDGGVAYTWLAR
ncbi:ABC transporter substrate-binding protein [Falsiroseomonas selenitidurans]|uniref:ABC transporter substrate-binding protein n=1 Tax=Falsiroseomonas selenitidurans TaxID=2716335 RepID=A0ABX1E2Y7_9PROT|nr:ABC transporter substrate-binding protein [Falsiroseomonas selenitidurans]NKC31123.1 ABC transporter substrate-binding protein [Falsiroseomonas selenitidurans]